jgi:pyruvate ferredoxin oxidoreductase beta subunit
MASIKDAAKKPAVLVGGHRLCPGCGAGVVVRQVLAAADAPVVVSSATGCLEVSTTGYPYTSWDAPFIHSAFENAAATISGVEAAYKGLMRAGKIPTDKKIRFVAFGGDGGTYDIGLQALSGAMERGHDILYVCYDNGAYMNTGIQRSSATPFGAWTTTTPVGKARAGKLQFRKNLTEIIAAHNIPYLAQASISHYTDLMKKAEKAFQADGPAFLNILSPCPRGWRHPNDQTIEMAKLGVETKFWPLYEVEDGRYRITKKVREPLPLVDFLKPQGRFKHMFALGNEGMLEQAQAYVDREYARLETLAGTES